MRAVTVVCWVVITATVAGPAWGQRVEEARRHFIEGRKFFKQNKFDAAVRAFNAAYKLRPSPLLDYNIGRCHAELGQRGLAIAAFKRYLDARPNATNREEVLDRIAKLESAAKPPDRTPSPPAATTDPPAPTNDLRRPPPPPATAPAAQPRHEAETTSRVPALSAAAEPGVAANKGGAPKQVASATAASPPHEASLPRSRSGARKPAQAKPKARPRARHPAPGRPDTGPVYKQWWFWVGCAAGAVIVGFIIGTAASRSDSGEPQKATGGLQITF